MNNDLISREALKKAFENLASDDYNEPIWYQQTVFETIDNAPTVEAIPLEVHEKAMDIAVDDLFKVQEELNRIRNEKRQGEWNYIQAGMCVCKFCGAMPHKEYKNFCPNCGADMRGNTKRKGTPIEGNNESYNCEDWIP